MRIFDSTKTIELTEPNCELGYLKEDTITIHHEATQHVEEQGHWKTLVEYPNGGKDVEWVVDIEGVEGHEAYDETENILVYVPFTEAELQRRRNEAEIAELKAYLDSTDYVVTKLAEAQAFGEDTTGLRAQYAETIQRRKAARRRIEELGG